MKCEVRNVLDTRLPAILYSIAGRKVFCRGRQYSTYIQA